MFRIEPADANLRERFGPEAVGVLTLGPDPARVGPAGGRPPLCELDVPWIPPEPNQTLRVLSDWTSRMPPFAGRDLETADLLAWAESEPAISVRFLAGDSGCGKSHLAAELCETLG